MISASYAFLCGRMYFSLAEFRRKGDRWECEEVVSFGTAKVSGGLQEAHLSPSCYLMIHAAGEGDVRTACGYLVHGVSPEAKNHEGSTAVFTAAAGGGVPVLELLASSRADLSSMNSYGDSPLEAATENHHDAAVSFLKSKGAVQVKGTSEQRDAASHAIVQRDIERMQHLH